MPTPKLLTLKQLDFCSRYLSSGNGAKSYRAVYKCSQAAAAASAARVLRDERVKVVIEAARRDAHAKCGLSAEWLARKVKDEAEREDPDATSAGRVAVLKLAGLLLANITFDPADRATLEAILERAKVK
jgi:phage terminase small subunit